MLKKIWKNQTKKIKYRKYSVNFSCQTKVFFGDPILSKIYRKKTLVWNGKLTEYRVIFYVLTFYNANKTIIAKRCFKSYIFLEAGEIRLFNYMKRFC
jgi:hypothetical protein